MHFLTLTSYYSIQQNFNDNVTALIILNVIHALNLI